jgi:SWI/SNF-related matrix-associated actin-dependent regulator 1 of chromatin subfamily A
LSNWERELEKWAPALEVLIYHGPQNERMQMQEELFREMKKSKSRGQPFAYDVLVATYQTVASKFDKALFRKMHFAYLILDEAHSIKNKGSQRYQSLYKLRSDRRVLLTGTPLQNNLEELWTLLEFLMPKLFTQVHNPKAIFTELQRVKKREPERAKALEFKYIDRMKKLLAPFILRRLKSQVRFGFELAGSCCVWKGVNIPLLYGLGRLPTRSEEISCRRVRNDRDSEKPLRFDLLANKRSVVGGA